MRGSISAPRRGRFESLEQKCLLAGDVLVSVIDGSLVIEGDELGNNVAVTAGAEAGAFIVSGLDGTTVHEEGETPAAEVVVNGVTRGLRVDLGEGDDVFALAEASLRGNVSIRTGAGEDTVDIGMDSVGLAQVLPGDASVRIGGSLSIRTDGDNDNVSVNNAAIGGSLNIGLGVGDDMVALGGLAAPVATAGLLGIPNGNDVDASLHVRGSLNVDLGDGNDDLDMNHVRTRWLATVRGGLGDDEVNVQQSGLLALLISTHDGADIVSLNGLHASHVVVNTGDGDDEVSVVDSVFASLGVSLGEGDDMLTIDSVRARFASLLGGLGEDTLNEIGDNNFVHEIVRGFEIPPDVNTPRVSVARKPSSTGSRVDSEIN